MLRGLRELTSAGLSGPEASDPGLEGDVLRLHGDLQWLESCAQGWSDRRMK